MRRLLILGCLLAGCAAPAADVISFEARSFAYRIGRWEERLETLCKAKKLDADVCKAGRADLRDAKAQLAKPPSQRNPVDLDKALDLGLTVLDKLL